VGTNIRRRLTCRLTYHTTRRRPAPSERLFHFGRLLEERFEVFVELFHLGADDELAVLLAGVQVEVVLVVFLGGEEVLDRGDLGDDRRFERAGFVELFFVLLSDTVLIFIVVEDCRAVLRAGVVALTVERGGIVSLPENF